MLVPLLTWALTGVFFLIKPGYAGAYEKLSVRTYPLEGSVQVDPQANWREFRVLKTILGDHLLVSTQVGALHLNPRDLTVRPKPGSDDLMRLLSDALSANVERYGRIVEVHEAGAVTNTGVELNLDWNTMTVHQRGKDTRIISLLYKIHYLQWSSIGVLDTMLGVLSIALLLVLTVFGALMSFKPRED